MYEFIEQIPLEQRKTMGISKSVVSTRSASRANSPRKSLNHKYVKEHAEYTKYEKLG